MNNFKNMIIASATLAVAGMSLSAVAALSTTEQTCANYLNSSTNQTPDEATTSALTYCMNHYSCNDELGDKVSNCSSKLSHWQFKQTVQAAKTKTQSSSTTTTASPSKTPTPTPTPIPTQKKSTVVTPATSAIPATTTTDTNNQTNTKKTDKPSINWF